MSIDSLIQIITLIVALYAILPKSYQYSYKYRISLGMRIFSVFIFVIINILIFYESLVHIGFGIIWPLIISPNQAAYIVFIIYAILISILITNAKLSRMNIRQFSNLIFELYRTKQFSEITYLFEKEYIQLINIYYQETLILKLQKKFYKWGKVDEINSDLISDDSLQLLIEKQKHKGFSLKLFLKESSIKFSAIVYRLFPDNDVEIVNADNILRLLLVSEDYINYLTENYPLFVITLFRTRIPYEDSALDIFIASLIKNRSSIYYEEMNNVIFQVSRNMSQITRSNQFLFFFLSDIKVAYELDIGTKVGNHLVHVLRKRNRDPNNDSYNYYSESYFIKEKYKCPIFIGIAFIDLLVLSALKQGFEWHMNLFIYNELTNQIINNYESKTPNNQYNDWENNYSYLLHEMIEKMGKWVTDVEYYPLNQKNISLIDTSARSENNNIPKSTLLCMVFCLNSIIKTRNIDIRTKSKLVNLVIGLFFDLYENEELHDFAIVLKNMLISHLETNSLIVINSTLKSTEWVSRELMTNSKLQSVIEFELSKHPIN